MSSEDFKEKKDHGDEVKAKESKATEGSTLLRNLPDDILRPFLEHNNLATLTLGTQTINKPLIDGEDPILAFYLKKMEQDFKKAASSNNENEIIQELNTKYQRIFEILLKNGADPNVKFKTALEGGTDTVETTPLIYVMAFNRNEILKLLLESGKANPNLTGQLPTTSGVPHLDASLSPIIFAARLSNQAQTNLLLEHGADLTATFPDTIWGEEEPRVHTLLDHFTLGDTNYNVKDQYQNNEDLFNILRYIVSSAQKEMQANSQLDRQSPESIANFLSNKSGKSGFSTQTHDKEFWVNVAKAGLSALSPVEEVKTKGEIETPEEMDMIKKAQQEAKKAKAAASTAGGTITGMDLGERDSKKGPPPPPQDQPPSAPKIPGI